jgi:tetratricopeptide (TPR) repeat protein
MAHSKRAMLCGAVACGWLLAVTPALQSQQGSPQPQEKGAGELQKERSKPPASTKEAIPAEEDTAVAPTEYAFNPLQAQKELQTGNFYFKKGSFRAAAGRFREATRWNEGFSEAWLRLGEVQEKLHDPKAAREAYGKYLELAADAKNASEVRKRLERLK